MSQFVNISITGGLGNQMFQVAACLGYAWKHKLQPIFLKGEWQGMETHPGTHWNSFLVRLKEYLVDSLPRNIMNYHLPHWNSTSVPSPAELSNFHCIRLNGYFQSEKHFKDYRSEILQLFKPEDHVTSKLNQRYHHINPNDSGILHIRRGDLVGLEHIHPIMPVSYYKEAIQLLESKAGKRLKWYIISEKKDQTWIKNQELFKDFTLIDNQENLDPDPEIRGPERSEDYEDLCTMWYFKYLIIANSTFSWWGAWLNQHPDKTVVCPKNWFGPAGPQPFDSIYPEGWIQV